MITKKGRAQVFEHDAMVIDTYLVILRDFLLPKLKVVSYATLSSMKTTFSNPISLLHFSFQSPCTNTQQSLASKVCPPEQNFDIFDKKFCFNLTHPFRSYRCR